MFYNNHPAPGFGDLLPGFFVVPQNPFTPPVRVPGIGDILPGRFIVPQNPLRDALGMSGGCGCGCGGSGGCGSSDKGVGYVNGIPFTGMSGVMDDVTGALSGDVELPYVGAVPMTYVLAGAGLLLFVLMGRGDSSSAYQSDLAKLRSRHPTRASRLRRAAASY